ncbi:MAG: plasmid stabilization protein [Candidatus Contendobacter sp.]|nr:plasmid stabilization protein [Candidatus Contendobacter sp.]
MANLTIRKLEPAIKERLRLRAARCGHSMEEEVRCILREACPPEPEAATAYARLRRYFVHLDGVALALPPRQPGRRPPEFD